MCSWSQEKPKNSFYDWLISYFKLWLNKREVAQSARQCLAELTGLESKCRGVQRYLLGFCRHWGCFVRCLPEWEESDGAEGNPAHQNQSIWEIRGESEVSGGFTSERRSVLNSFTKAVLHNQNDTVTGAQEWERSWASFLMARLARTSMTQFIHL